MARKKSRQQGTNTAAQKPPREVESHRRCPICWQGQGGYGTAYSKHGSTTYYKCTKTDKAGAMPCGHTWTALIRVEVVRVEHRSVSMSKR